MVTHTVVILYLDVGKKFPCAGFVKKTLLPAAHSNIICTESGTPFPQQHILGLQAFAHRLRYE